MKSSASPLFPFTKWTFDERNINIVYSTPTHYPDRINFPVYGVAVRGINLKRFLNKYWLVLVIDIFNLFLIWFSSLNTVSWLFHNIISVHAS